MHSRIEIVIFPVYFCYYYFFRLFFFSKSPQNLPQREHIFPWYLSQKNGRIFTSDYMCTFYGNSPENWMRPPQSWTESGVCDSWSLPFFCYINREKLTVIKHPHNEHISTTISMSNITQYMFIFHDFSPAFVFLCLFLFCFVFCQHTKNYNIKLKLHSVIVGCSSAGHKFHAYSDGHFFLCPFVSIVQFCISFLKFSIALAQSVKPFTFFTSNGIRRYFECYIYTLLTSYESSTRGVPELIHIFQFPYVNVLQARGVAPSPCRNGKNMNKQINNIISSKYMTFCKPESKLVIVVDDLQEPVCFLRNSK